MNATTPHHVSHRHEESEVPLTKPPAEEVGQLTLGGTRRTTNDSPAASARRYSSCENNSVACFVFEYTEKASYGCGSTECLTRHLRVECSAECRDARQRHHLAASSTAVSNGPQPRRQREVAEVVGSHLSSKP